VPSFLEQRHGIQVTQVGLPLLVIYLTTTLGSVAGGWLSSTMIARGYGVNFSRKIAMLLCALCVVPIFFASIVTNLWSAVFLVALAAAAHQGFSCNIFTVASDVVPKRAVSTVVGIGGMFGAIGGMFFAKFVGFILDVTHKNYFIPFAICSSAYLVGLLFLHLLLPRLQPMEYDPD
jgi:ACS family hexuronate transporter-like MFS transporter